MKILITGKDGFIARNLFEQLRSEYAVTALNRKKLDLLDSTGVLVYLKKNPFEIIIHAATYDAAPINSPKDPTRVLEHNLTMFFNLARCRDYFGRMIYFGSGAEFGREHWKPKMKEDYFGRHIPVDQYGLSKYLMTQHAQLSPNIYNLRLFGVFGEYDNWRYRFISNACCKAVLGLPITFRHNKVFDFLYVDDLIRIVKWFIRGSPQHRVYNVCSGKSFEFRTLAQKIIQAAGKDLEILVESGNPRIEYSGDNSLLLQELKNFKFSSIDDSIQKMYNWYNTHRRRIKKEEFHY